MTPAGRAKPQLTQRLLHCGTYNVIDQTGIEPGEVALYTLSDPRDVQLVRYVGQTRDPVARFRQHVNAARLWLPDETPWWVKRSRLRPLYAWIRDLYHDGARLPVMFIVAWTTAALARSDERRFIRTFISGELPLLNSEAVAARKNG